MGHYYTPRNFKEFALYTVAMVGAVGLFSLGGAAVSVAIEYQQSKKICEKISQNTGLKIKHLEELYLYNDSEGCKVVARCEDADEKIVLLEYSVSFVDYVKMNDDSTDKLEFFKKSILPNYSPRIIVEPVKNTEKQSKQKTSSNDVLNYIVTKINYGNDLRAINNAVASSNKLFSDNFDCYSN